MAKKAPVLDASQIEITDEPPVWKWVIGLSCATLVVGALYAVDLFGTSFYYISLHTDLQKQILEAESVEAIVSKPEFQPLLAQHNNELRALVGVHGFVAKQEFERAISWSKDPALKRVPSASGLAAAVEALEEATASISTNKKALEQARQEHRGLVSQYSLLGTRLARLMNQEDAAQELETKAEELAKGDGPIEPVALYESGVFAGLPSVTEIPDGIETFSDLAKFMRNPGELRSLNRSLNNPSSEFRKELTALLTESSELAGLVEASTALIDSAAEADQGTGEAILAAKQKLREETSKIIAALSVPQLSERALGVYAFVKDQGILGSLPELKVS
jgi:hypothetical protein